MKKISKKTLYLFSILSIFFILILIFGESHTTVARILWNSTFASIDDFSRCLFYATPILLTASSAALALDCGLFNIGAEGQMYFGALGSIFGVSLLGHQYHDNPFFIFAIGFFFSCVFGATLGGIAGFLRSYRGVHEVISTILLNFISINLCSWLILSVFKNPQNQNTETFWIPEAARLSPLWSNVTKIAPLALIIAMSLRLLVKKSSFGFQVRATGLNSEAAELGGIHTKKIKLWVMALSGAIASLAGYNEVFGHAYRMIDGFSPGYGFAGLAVALLARGKLPLLLVSAFIFGSIQKGAIDFEIETEKITKDFAPVVQALVLFAMAFPMTIQKTWKKKEKQF